jgi:hypothetical protein
MRQFLPFLILIIFAQIDCSFKKDKASQSYFEGKIVYRNQFIIKSHTESAQALSTLTANQIVLYFKNGNSIESYDKGYVSQDLYLSAENKMYTKEKYSDTLYWFDCSKPGETILKHSVTRKKEIILGIPCDELTMNYEKKTVRFYYNSDTLKINPTWYKNLTYTNRHFTSRIMQSVPLKIVIEREDYKFTSTVISISHEKVDDKVFDIPSTAILVEDK